MGKAIYTGFDKMRVLTFVIALVTFITVGVVTQSFAEDYWISSDDWGMPSVTDKKPTDTGAAVQGPFKYYDQAVRRMGTGTEWRSRCYITGSCTNAKHLGK